jgi:predicted transcriptional regulator
MTVEEIAETIGKTARGVKTMLTRRGLSASNYDGAAKQAKAAG